MKKKKLTALCLSAVLSASFLLGGCGGNEEGKSNESSGSAASQSEASGSTSGSAAEEVAEAGEVSYPVDSEGEKLTVWCPIQPPAAKYITSYNDQKIYQEISKLSGIEVEFIHPAIGQEKEQLGILMASDELPDIIQIRDLYSGGAIAGVDDGVFLDLTELMPQYAPDYYKLITANAESYRLATNNEGRILSFEIIKQTGPAFERINFLDTILEKYEITELPETIADYEEIFAKFQKDGLPGFAPIKSGQVEQFMWPYGIAPGFFIGEDGNIRWGAATEEYRDYLEMMNRWYKNGYLHKDFMGEVSVTERRAWFTNLQVGMLIDATDLANSMAASAGYASQPVNFPRMTEGQEIHFNSVSDDTLPAGGMTTVITSSCKNPELAMKYLNYFYTQEGADLANWGIKDLTYTEDENGKKTYTDYMLKNEEIALGDIQTMMKIHLTAKLAEPDVVCNPNVVADEHALSLRMLYSDDPTVDNSQVIPRFDMSMEAATKRNEIMTDINTYVDEMTLKFITGDESLDRFDAYLEQLKKMGIDDAIAITQEEYSNFMNKPMPAGLAEKE